MSSNSPVLLLAPSSVPTAPIMAPLLVPKTGDLRPRGLLPSPSLTPAGKPLEPISYVTKSPRTTVITPSAAVTSPIVELKPLELAPPAPVAPQVANAAPAVATRTASSPTSTQLPSPTIVIPDVPVATPAVAPAGPVLTRAMAAPASSTSSPMTKRAAAVAAAAAATAAASPSPLSISTTSSPVTSPKAASSSSPSSSPKSGGKSSTGRWTEAEHKLFLKGLEQFPYRAWKKIATLIKTRTVVQIRTHAQKYYQKLEKEEQRMREREAQLAAQQHQQGAASASAAAAASSSLSSAATTPRAAAMLSAPTTPSAAAVASFRELSLASPFVTTPSASAAASSHFSDFGGGAMGKRKAPMRKRKSSTDSDVSEPPSSLPKRMMKEKKVLVREKTMSPKQKTATANGRAFGFGGDDASSGDDCAKSSNVRSGLSGLKTHPLDFDDDDDITAATTSTMLLDFTEEKPMVSYPFTLDSALERGLAAIDHDELLQLSDDDDAMEWFAAAHDDLLGDLDGSERSSGQSDVSFAPLYSEDALHFVDPAPIGSAVVAIAAPTSEHCSTPSPILSSASADFGLSSDEVEDDDDFVLDPEKFLSSYFHPDIDMDMNDEAL
jgi:SHAQKYF class myb-like DNA-binding protein